MKMTALGTLVGAAALAMFIGVTAAGAGGRAARLEARATVIWVLTDSFTGEVLSVRNGAIDVTATDTCPSTDCGDLISASIDDGTQVTEGTFEMHPLPGHANLFLPGGVDLQFVDGGQPGTRTVGPPNSAGVAPTTDYVQWLNTGPSVVLKGLSPDWEHSAQGADRARGPPPYAPGREHTRTASRVRRKMHASAHVQYRERGCAQSRLPWVPPLLVLPS